MTLEPDQIDAVRKWLRTEPGLFRGDGWDAVWSAAYRVYLLSGGVKMEIWDFRKAVYDYGVRVETRPNARDKDRSWCVLPLPGEHITTIEIE